MTPPPPPEDTWMTLSPRPFIHRRLPVQRRPPFKVPNGPSARRIHNQHGQHGLDHEEDDGGPDAVSFSSCLFNFV